VIGTDCIGAITLTIIDIRLTNGNVSARLLILTGRKKTTEDLQGINHLTTNSDMK
jgi:hypothetical protein